MARDVAKSAMRPLDSSLARIGIPCAKIHIQHADPGSWIDHNSCPRQISIQGLDGDAPVEGFGVGSNCGVGGGGVDVAVGGGAKVGKGVGGGAVAVGGVVGDGVVGDACVFEFARASSVNKMPIMVIATVFQYQNSRFSPSMSIFILFGVTTSPRNLDTSSSRIPACGGPVLAMGSSFASCENQIKNNGLPTSR